MSKLIFLFLAYSLFLCQFEEKASAQLVSDKAMQKIGNENKLKVIKDQNLQIRKLELYDSLDHKLVFSLDIDKENPYQTVLDNASKSTEPSSLFDISQKESAKKILNTAQSPEMDQLIKIARTGYTKSTAEIYESSFSAIYSVYLYDSDNNIILFQSQAEIFNGEGEKIFQIAPMNEGIRGLCVPNNKKFIGISYGDSFGEIESGTIAPPGVKIISIPAGNTIYVNNSIWLIGMYCLGNKFIVAEYTETYGRKIIVIDPEQSCAYQYTITETEYQSGFNIQENYMELNNEKKLFYVKDFTKVMLE